MVKTIVVVAIYGGGWVDGGTDSGNGSGNVGGWVATVVEMILCSGYAPLDYVRRSYTLHKLADVMCLWCKDFAGNRKANSRFTKSTRFGMSSWCKDFAEHRNANSRLTKSGRFGEPTLYPAFTVSYYRICDSRHSPSALGSLISAAIGISTVNQVIRPR
ncbi:hypothetical protein PoB_005376400 [Plakobranchus ocellatus]|uniref:Uncharacterized protein n=1 Tax=Plakobranchus ocellatus TaxID=259542 RepID=A0AAV4C3Y5_9GAST|nr:hypothetical protein PoB_005376400 [Plakobranchus ocellatus]